MMQARQLIRSAKRQQLERRFESNPAPACSRRGQQSCGRGRSGSESEDQGRFGVRFAAGHNRVALDSMRIDNVLYAFGCACGGASASRANVEAPPDHEGDRRSDPSEHER